jgi:hypothetical protein
VLSRDGNLATYVSLRPEKASTAPRGRALLYSLVQRCTLVGLSPFTYLKDVLLRVATHPHQRLDQLTPRSWAATLTGTAVRRHDGVCRTHTRTFPESDSGWAAPSDANTSISAIDRPRLTRQTAVTPDTSWVEGVDSGRAIPGAHLKSS